MVDEHREIEEAILGVEMQVEADGCRAYVVTRALVELKVAESPRRREDGRNGAAICRWDGIFDGVRGEGSFRKDLTLNGNAVGLAVCGGRPGVAVERESGASCACDAYSVMSHGISTLSSTKPDGR